MVDIIGVRIEAGNDAGRVNRVWEGTLTIRGTSAWRTKDRDVTSFASHETSFDTARTSVLTGDSSRIVDCRHHCSQCPAGSIETADYTGVAPHKAM